MMLVKGCHYLTGLSHTFSLRPLSLSDHITVAVFAHSISITSCATKFAFHNLQEPLLSTPPSCNTPLALAYALG